MAVLVSRTFRDEEGQLQEEFLCHAGYEDVMNEHPKSPAMRGHWVTEAERLGAKWTRDGRAWLCPLHSATKVREK